MAAMTNYLQKSLLDMVLTLAAWTMPDGIWISLHTASPTESGSQASEVPTSGTDYARQPLTTAMSVTSPTTGISTNTGVITIGPALIDWGLITYVAVEDAETLGNMLLYGALTEAQNEAVGESFQLATGQFSIQFD